MRLKQQLGLLIMTVLVAHSAPGFNVQAAAPARPGFDDKLSLTSTGVRQ